MRSYGRTINAFHEAELSQYLDTRTAELGDEIRAAADEYILNVSQTEFASYLTGKYRVERLEFDFDGLTIEKREEMIPAERFPSGYHVYPGKSYPKPVVTFFLPFAGYEGLLRLRPSRYEAVSHEVEVRDGHVCFDVISFKGDAEEVKRESDGYTGFLSRMSSFIAADIDSYNERLSATVSQLVAARKQEVLKQHELLAALDIPLRRKDTVPKTFAVPTPTDRYAVAVRPQVTEKGYQPEPTLDTDSYRAILRIVGDVLRLMEQHPSLYEDRDEEALRDQLLLHLSPRFEWSVTGETFNRVGKTDILIKYESSNLFAAECKFWRGAKNHTRMLDQLLSYLTWRDSKTAAVVFVRNKGISAALDAAADATRSHPCSLGEVDRPREGWINYRFHVIGDPNREVRLALMLCHVPPSGDTAGEESSEDSAGE